MTCWYIGYILFIITLWYRNIDSTLVKVEQGWLRGEIKMTSTNMGQYYSFKGIPYAAPPLGKLRFKTPESPLPWKGVRSATEHGSICMQPVSYSNLTAIGSEDCLFINVYTPDINPKHPLPVMFFIHGGLYVKGSGNSNMYGPDFLMSHDVVLVTSNFRLGAFGFLAIDTPDVPGNAGMNDNIAALQWVQKNIINFGGDPDCVTIFGQSSGSAMISFHIVAPSAKNLYKRAVAMSGTFFNDFSVQYEPRRRAFALGRVLGLDTKDASQLTNYLQSVPAEKLIRARPNFILSDNATIELLLTPYYTPNIEKKFGNGSGQYITTRQTLIMCNREYNPVDIMIGHTASEGSEYTAETEDTILKYFPYYKELLVPLKIRLFRSPKEVLRLADRIKQFYFKDKAISRETILDFIKFSTYNRYVFDIHGYIERLPKLTGVRRYMYEFSIYSSRNYCAKFAEKYGIKEATHGDDLPYLFDGSFWNFTLDVKSEAFKYVELVCKLYTNFAKYGTPTPDDSLGLIWPEYDPDRNYVNIGRNGTLTSEIVPAFTERNLKFWRELYISTGIKIY